MQFQNTMHWIGSLLQDQEDLFLNLTACREPMEGTSGESTQNREFAVRYIGNGTKNPKLFYLNLSNVQVNRA